MISTHCLGLYLQVEVGDGLQALDKREPGTLDALIVDAGASDASLAISCPPAPFLQTNFLKKAACTLRLQGIFVVNCVTRSQAAFKTAFESIQVCQSPPGHNAFHGAHES